MGLFQRLFGKHGAQSIRGEPQHAVLVYLNLSDAEFGTQVERGDIHELSDRMDQAIRADEAGEFDGDEFGDGVCTLYMYGPDADKLFSTVEPLLRDAAVCQGAYAIKRYGEAQDAEAKEVRVEL